jgi:putative Holliday junction resolvase
MNKVILLGLDVGEKRIGVARGDNDVRLAVPCLTVQVDENIIQTIHDLVQQYQAEIVVIGYPRNQTGESTAQTKKVEDFADRLKGLPTKIVFQDESVSSILAENKLKEIGKPYDKPDIDMQAATIILQDYLEANYATV